MSKSGDHPLQRVGHFLVVALTGEEERSNPRSTSRSPSSLDGPSRTRRTTSSTSTLDGRD
jgi:hypothetical protein